MKLLKSTILKDYINNINIADSNNCHQQLGEAIDKSIDCISNSFTSSSRIKHLVRENPEVLKKAAQDIADLVEDSKIILDCIGKQESFTKEFVQKICKND